MDSLLKKLLFLYKQYYHKPYKCKMYLIFTQNTLVNYILILLHITRNSVRLIEVNIIIRE